MLGSRQNFTLGLFATVIAAGGCIPVPNIGEEPFRDELGRLEPNIATKAEVIELLGNPVSSHHSGSELLYHGTDWQAFVLGGSGSSAGADSIDRDYYLLVRFDESGVLSEYLLADRKVGDAPTELKSLIAAAFDLESDAIDFAQRTLVSSTRGCDSFKKSNNLWRDAYEVPEYLAFGSDHLGVVRWQPYRFTQRWKRSFDDVTSVSIDGSFGGNCVVIDFSNGTAVTFVLVKKHLFLGFVGSDNRTTKRTGKELQAKMDLQ